MQPCAPTRGERERDFVTRLQAAGAHGGVLVDRHRVFPAIVRCNQPQLARQALRRERKLFVAGFEAVGVGLDPDLQQMHRLVLRGVVFAVRDAVAGAHALRFAGPDQSAVA